ncbi:MAG: type II toxin-antitoxin system VapC family toxin [Terriglobia bacterium]
MSAYADTSFLVSLYVLDGNSALAAAQMKRVALPLSLSPLGEIEIANAFQLRLFRKELDHSKVKAAQKLFREDVANGVIALRPLPPAAFDEARRLAEKHTRRLGTRSLDVLHVASALVLRAETFYTFDEKQRKLAKAEGLLVP